MNTEQYLQLLIIPVIGAIFAYIKNIQEKNEKAIELSRANCEKEWERLRQEQDNTREVLSDWQLEVVRNYATRAELERLENRIVSAIERLEKKIEHFFTRESGDD